MKGEKYRIGDRVVHDVFGRGVVRGKYSNTSKKVVVVQFDSLKTERNIVADFNGIRRVK